MMIGFRSMKTSVIKTPNDFKDWMINCKDIFSLDTECTSLNWLDLEIIGFSLCDGTQACYVDIHRKYKKELLMILDFYLSEAKMVIMHNASFDCMVLLKEGIEI
ncbi:hypothetical protein LCGC14_0404410 [marine sediment metagenome]|uniref:3'-5' exonuclease domain-containing protein n=1 Tax=marine sediment metagenome TaxID=412755 RepID=A0A0F9TDY9_9ZZZZ